MENLDQSKVGPTEGVTATAKELLGGAAAVFTVSAVLIYFAGAVVLALRMEASGFRSALVLSQMPRPVLQEIAASSVFLPAALLALFGYLVPRILLPTNSWLPRRLGQFLDKFPRSAFLLLTVLLMVPGVILWLQWDSYIPEAGLICLAVIAVVGFALMIGSAVQQMQKFREARPGLWIAVVTMAVMLAAIPGAVVGAGGLPLQYARACGSGYELEARIIGAASDWVYLGEYSFDEHDNALPPQLVLVPTSRVSAVTVSEKLHTRAGCALTDCVPTTGRLGTTTASPS
ncbi:hypothetical protein ABZ725_50650 [Streptomyces sp. NPDC006872]|uniref:hypothetical protein n=1 Tax=Streptomyces sp. NPDC006872 TaxID=3155720 RepID=UPI0033E8ECBA